jgi:hypothetical protein
MLRLANAFHTGVVVRDVDEAIAEYAAAFTTGWTSVERRELALRGPDGAFRLSVRVAYSVEGPHRIELIDSVPGTMWESPSNAKVGVTAAHHTGFWSDDVAAESRALSVAGCPLLATLDQDVADVAYLAYHRMPNGSLIELVDVAIRAGMEEWWAGRAPFPARPI